MRRIISIIFIMLISLSLFAVEQAEEGVDYAIANVYFTATTHSVFGFSDGAVDTVVQPDVMSDEIYFESIGNNLIRTKQFYVYYQIFTPNKVRLKLAVQNYSNDNNITTPADDSSDPWWKNVAKSTSPGLNNFNSTSTDSTDSTDCTGGVIVYEDTVDNNKPRVDSFPIVLDLNMSKLGNMDWSTKYGWHLVLSIEAVS